MDDKNHIQHTVYTGNRINIPVEELKLGVDNDASTLATQETSVNNLAYITNIQEGKLGTMKNAQDNSKNPSKQDNKKPTAKTSPLEKSISVDSNGNLKAYGESGIDDNLGRDKERKKKTKNTKKVIHMEFNMDDDVEEQPKNANDVKAEWKVRVRKKSVHFYEFSSEDEEGQHANLKKIKKATDDHEILCEMMKKIRLLSPRK